MTTHLVILESMWGWRDPGSVGSRAPHWFPINPENHSGKRLHRILGADPEERSVWVTNACPGVQRTAKDHGTPDPERLRTNIIKFPGDIGWLIVGGKVAEATLARAVLLDKTRDVPHGRFALREKLANSNGFFMPHPAARWWSKEMERVITAFLAAPPPLESVPLLMTWQPEGPVHNFTRTAQRAWHYKWNGKKEPEKES